VRAGARAEPVRRERDPDDALGLAIEGGRNGGLRHVDRRTGMQHAANRTAALMGAMAGLVALFRGRDGIAVTDHGPGERIGGGDARSPGCTDRCEDLHDQGNQHYGQKILQPPAHHKTHPSAQLITMRVRSRDSVPGFILRPAVK